MKKQNRTARQGQSIHPSQIDLIQMQQMSQKQQLRRNRQSCRFPDQEQGHFKRNSTGLLTDQSDKHQRFRRRESQKTRQYSKVPQSKVLPLMNNQFSTQFSNQKNIANNQVLEQDKSEQNNRLRFNRSDSLMIGKKILYPSILVSSERDSQQDTKIFKKIFMRNKVRQLVQLYIRKIHQYYNLSRSPMISIPNVAEISSQYQNQLSSLSKNSDNSNTKHMTFIQKLSNLPGIYLNQHIASFLLLFEIVMILILSVLSTYEIFFEEFRAELSFSPEIIAIKIIVLVSIAFSILRKLLVVKVIHGQGKRLEKLKDIIIYTIFSIHIYIDLTLALLLLIFFAADQSIETDIAIGYFLVAYLKLFFKAKKLQTSELKFINTFHKEQYWNLFKMFVFDMFLAHLIANVLLAISFIPGNQTNWIVYYELDVRSWYIKYIWAYYWAVTIMMTVGFGDISPKNEDQAIVIAFIEMFSCIILAYNISEVGSIISKIRRTDEQAMLKLTVFHRMVRQDQIDKNLSRRIETYLKETTKIRLMSDNQQKNSLLDQIPMNLKRQYLIQANRKIFEKLPFFNHLQKDTLIQFTKNFDSKIYYPGEHINLSYNFHTNKIQQHNPWIIILKKGQVGYGYRRRQANSINGTILQVVSVDYETEYSFYENSAGKKSLFSKLGVLFNSNGQISQKQIKRQFKVNYTKLNYGRLLDVSFIAKMRSLNYDLIAQSYCFIYSLKHSDFFQILRQFDMDFCYYFSLRHKRQIDQNQYQFIKCPYCPNQFHSCFYCPKIQYLPIRGAILLKSLGNNHKKVQRTRYRRMKNQSFFMSCPLKLQHQFFTKGITKNYQISSKSMIMRLSKETRNLPLNLADFATKLTRQQDYHQYQSNSNLNLMTQQMKKHNITKTMELLTKTLRHTLETGNIQQQIKHKNKSKKKESHKNQLHAKLSAYNRFYHLETFEDELAFQTKKNGFDECDTMHNFVAYFQRNNPSHLIYVPLSKKVRKERKIAFFD